MLKTVPNYIIAIGASAGGMEEIISFFDHTPVDGVAYVIVQHLSPDFKSRMVDLLARHSKLLVKEATEAMEIECNEVYLIPNDKYMTTQNNRFHLTDKLLVKGPHLTVNEFFTSLATNSGKKAIGVILSGLGQDGTEGVKAIKKAGGMVIARNPETAEFSSMPSHAIATGLVDFVLEPAAMPATIEDYVQQEEQTLYNTKEDDKNMAIILDLIKAKSPHDFSEYKQTTILRRIKRRAANNNFTNLAAYIEFLKTKPDEIEALTQDFLISVTSFFRDKEAFDFLEKEILPAIVKKLVPDEEIKVWVTGCATGEEAYSLAILLAEQLTGNLKTRIVKIFATDLDNTALTFAGKGVYPAGIAKDISSVRLQKYFIKVGTSYTIKPEIRKMVIFAQHDLVKNPPYCNMHLISCRNLLIYMTPTLQKKVYLMLLFGIKMEGYLFLGSSENPLPILSSLEVVSKKWKIYRNLETKRFVRFDAFSLPVLTDKKPAPVTHEDTPPDAFGNLTDAVNNLLVTEQNQLIVCIDTNNQVVKSFGDTTKYLLQKNFNSNLADLLPRSLAVAFNTVAASVQKNGQKSAVHGIKIKKGDAVIKVSLSVNPLQIKKGVPQLLMVTFKEDTKAGNGVQEDIVFDEKIYLDQYTHNIEEELNELKNKLQAAYLQLDASNENMQSFNEELLSANEEMQSTNEEMQSVNEELHTINADYQLKNKELLEMNDDLNNYFRSNINGQLFVNKELQLMKFSPGTVQQINLLPTDVGRPLSHITTNIKFETITEDIKKVIAEGGVITKEIETENGKWFQVMTMPYIQADNTRNGAMITFNDITELKRTKQEVDKKNASLLRINADLDNFVHAASHDLLGPLGNIELSIAMMNEVTAADPKVIAFANIINSSVKKFRALITDIATIAKIESDMISMEMVDVDELISNIEWSLDDKIKASGAVIKRDIAIKHILFSKKNLRSILYNLISNAIKFTGDTAPVVTVKTSKNTDSTIISVEDNGLGIAREDVDKIFDMYGRLHQNIEGHGIGLYLAKKIVDAAGGNIDVESEPGKGSKFTILFKS